MKHLTEEELALHWHGQERRAAQHLRECSQCRAEYERLTAVLRAIAEPAAPERGDDYGAKVWASIRPRLMEARQPWWKTLLAPRRWAVAAAVAALVIAAFLAGHFYAQHPFPDAPQVAKAPEPGRPNRALVVALQEHLDRSQRLLVQLRHGDDPSQLAQELLSDNRLYRQSAEYSGQESVAQVLDQLERVLLDVAHAPAGSSAELEEIRKQVESLNLLFKIRVLRDNMRQQPRRENPQSQSRSSHAS